MEFEKDTPISDEQRRLAETKKITLQPVHANITPDDISDSEIANSHINGQPIANVHNDIEQEMPKMHQASSAKEIPELPDTRKQSMLIFFITLGAGILVIAASLFVISQI